jgi:hypothetical protein
MVLLKDVDPCARLLWSQIWWCVMIDVEEENVQMNNWWKQE